MNRLASLAAGEVPGRTSPKQITLFGQSSVQAVGSMALERYVYEIASRKRYQHIALSSAAVSRDGRRLRARRTSSRCGYMT
jgi:hypothetical protein